MDPPNKKPITKEPILQTYVNTMNKQNEASASTIIAVNEEADEEADAGITYFVDEEGRYYYQSSGENQSIVSLTTPAEEELITQTSMLVDSEEYQTVTLMPSESTGDVSYVLVVQEKSKPLVNIDIKLDQDTKDTDVYSFDEEEAAEEASENEEDLLPKVKTAPVKRGKYNRNNFSCNFCSYSTHRRYLLLRHMKSHSEDRPHKCKVCERGFKTLASLQNHVNMHNGVKPHICKYCNRPFTTSGELVRHVRYKHTHEKPHKCTECDYASVELSKLRRHVRCHTGERPYQCPHCTYASPDTFKLKRHLRTHTGEKPYKCDFCNMCFTQSNSLKAHKITHSIDSRKPIYACELCPVKCGRKTDLRIHVQNLHTSDKPLKCKRCGKSFPDRYSCKVHNKTHEGEKCFKCTLCPYASTTLRHLKSHMLKHTNEKPFSCDQCDQSFRQKQLLRRHQNIYHNPDYVPKPPKEKTHTCRECKRTFAHKGNLIRHLAIHDPDSGHREKALALRLGRQKRAKMVNGRLESIDESEHEQEDVVKLGMENNDLKQGEFVTVADGDGQQYVVLEVIQLEDGTEQQVAVVAPDTYIEDEEQVEEEEVEEPSLMEEKVTIIDPLQKKLEHRIKLEKEVDTCFGFDEEPEPEDEGISYNDKLVLHLV